MELDTSNMTDNSAFTIDLDETTLDVKLNQTDGEVTVTNRANGIECAVPDDPTVRFDVTGETLGGEPCRFGWPDFDSNSKIEIQSGSNGGGSYELTIVDEDDPTGDPPEATDAVYSVELDLRIDTADLSYERTARVAPGEPDV